MHYNGGKAAIAKEISKIINNHSPYIYWEPFVGAANVIQHINSYIKIGSDLCPYIIKVLDAIQEGWIPPNQVSESEYRHFKEHRPISAMTGFIGYGCSFSGKFFGGYARSGDRNYAKNAANSLMNKKLQDITFFQGDYEKIDEFLSAIPIDTIYLDPPYRNTTKVGSTSRFDTDKLFDWARNKAKQGIKVFLSEYEAPFKEIWSKEIKDGFIY